MFEIQDTLSKTYNKKIKTKKKHTFEFDKLSLFAPIIFVLNKFDFLDCFSSFSMK